MSFRQELSSRLREDKDLSLDELTKKAFRSRSIRGQGVQPNSDLVYNRDLTHLLDRLGDVLKVGTDAQREAYRGATTERQRKKVSEDYASFIKSVLQTKSSSSTTVGGEFKQGLGNWLGQRSQMLSKEQEELESTLEAITGESAKRLIELKVESYNPDIKVKGKSLMLPLNRLKENDILPYGFGDNAEESIAEIRSGERFPTEEEARNIVIENIDDLSRKAGVGDIPGLETLYKNGEINIITLNRSEIGVAEGMQDKRVIQSRTKSGAVEQTGSEKETIHSETYKLFKTLTGQRDEYSYDSIALMASGLNSYELIKTVLSYDTSSRVNEFRLTPENGTPGSPYQFYNELQEVTRSKLPEIREFGRSRRSAYGETTRNKIVQRWIRNEGLDPDTKNEEQYREALDEALALLSAQYESFVEDQATLDREIALNNLPDKGYLDAIVGFESDLITTQKSSTDGANGHVNVPFELLIHPFSAHYNKGVGALYEEVYGEPVNGPRVGEGNHQGYAQTRRGRKKKLQEKGLYEGYKAFEEAIRLSIF